MEKSKTAAVSRRTTSDVDAAEGKLVIFYRNKLFRQSAAILADVMFIPTCTSRLIGCSMEGENHQNTMKSCEIAL